MCHSRPPSVIPVKTGIQTGLDPQSEALRFRLRMTRKLSVEDDKGCVIPVKTGIQSEWIPHQVRDDKECVIPVKTGIQSEWIPHQVRDDKECVIPAQAGIQAGLDPQSEALCFRLRTA